MQRSLRIGVLGRAELRREGEPVGLSPGARSALALLALHAGEVVPGERLREALAPSSQAVDDVLAELRQALDGTEAVLLEAPAGSALRVDRGLLDAARFEQLLDEAGAARDAGDLARARERLDGALALWRGTAYDDLSADARGQAEATRLEQRRLAARQALAEGGPTDARRLPTGTVTLLLTDIEGSTRLLHRLGSGYADLLATHRAVIRDVLARHRGHEIDTIGDGFFAAFESARAAVAATVDLQRGLAQVPWPNGVEVRVRMGVHSGEPELGPMGYTGLAVHRVQRISSLGHGGQVLVSDTTRRLLDDGPDAGDDVRLLPLGSFQLRGVDAPIRLFQVAADGLRDTFPPLAGASRPAHLAPALTPLVGRERELASLEALLTRPEVRIVTLTGPGGSGKTRLAQATGELLHPRLEGGATFVPLDAADDPTLVLPAIAQALGIGETEPDPLSQRVAAELAAHEVLLILDNFEHVLPAARHVADLIAAAPNLTVLITSRAPLHVRGEHEVAVPPLELPPRGGSAAELAASPAVSLFVGRARQVAPGFALDEATAGAVAEMCHRLDGLPLAIELAAARVKLFSPAAMVSRLGGRLDLLAGRDSDAPARQRTLRDAIRWSCELLGPEELAAFRSLAVFAGGFTLAAADAVAGLAGPAASLDALEALVDHSLVRGADGDDRFAMLEVIREFALEQLAAAGEEGVVRARHAAYYVDLAEAIEPRLVGPGRAEAFSELERDLGNLRTALRFALDHQDRALGQRLAGALGVFWEAREDSIVLLVSEVQRMTAP